MVSFTTIRKHGEIQGVWGMKSCALTVLNLKGLLVIYTEVSGRWSDIRVCLAVCREVSAGGVDSGNIGLRRYLSCGIELDHHGGE